LLRTPQDSEDVERDANLRVALAVAESWVGPKLKDLGKRGDQVETFFDVSEDATLHLPADDCTVTKVKVFEYPSSGGVPLSPIELGFGHGYDLTDEGDVYLRPSLVVSPFEGASAGRSPRLYSRVEVFYTGTGEIPQNVTEGVAIIAAGLYTDTPRALGGMKREKIGDYEYELQQRTGADEPEYVSRALWLLKPSMKTSRVSVV
jgi:hypothetical protein